MSGSDPEVDPNSEVGSGLLRPWPWPWPWLWTWPVSTGSGHCSWYLSCCIFYDRCFSLFRFWAHGKYFHVCIVLFSAPCGLVVRYCVVSQVYRRHEARNYWWGATGQTDRRRNSRPCAIATRSSPVYRTVWSPIDVSLSWNIHVDDRFSRLSNQPSTITHKGCLYPYVDHSGSWTTFSSVITSVHCSAYHYDLTHVDWCHSWPLHITQCVYYVDHILTLSSKVVRYLLSSLL